VISARRSQVVQKKINTKAGLKENEGVGEARIEKYGDALLQLLGEITTTQTPAES
jgi:hypothetical protein